MANPTTYFGWVMPTNTDLVTDLPADFAVFGQGVYTSMQDLLGGTTGQVLSKTSATNMDFTWIAPPGFTYADYVPVFTSFTKGNATIVARYAQSGKAVNVFVSVTLGSTSSVSGSITVTLPVTAASTAVGNRGMGACQDTGVRSYTMASVMTSTTVVELKPLAASLATVAEDDMSATNPMTWTNTDKFFFSLTYEAA